MMKRLWFEDEGILTFEWILLLTVLVIGIVGGLGAMRDATIHEAQGVVGGMVNLDQSYYLAAPLTVSVGSVGFAMPGNETDNTQCTSFAASSQFQDTAAWEVDRGNQKVLVQGTSPTVGLCPETL